MIKKLVFTGKCEGFAEQNNVANAMFKHQVLIKTINSKQKFKYDTLRISQANLKEFLNFEDKIDVNVKNNLKKIYKTKNSFDLKNANFINLKKSRELLP